MGTDEDMNSRHELMRHDDEDRRKLVTKARHLIYADGQAMGGVAVERLLKEHSLVPTEVAFIRNFLGSIRANLSFIECLLYHFRTAIA